MGNAAGATNHRDTNTLADPENLVFLNLLHVGSHAAVVFANSDFHALSAGQAFFGGRTQQATGNCTDHGGNGMVNTIERWWYTNNPPPVGGTPDEIPMQGTLGGMRKMKRLPGAIFTGRKESMVPMRIVCTRRASSRE